MIKTSTKDVFLFKSKQNGISAELLHILSDFLSNRKQSVVRNGQYSSWTNVHAGVPQGSIIGPLLFWIYINNSSDNLTSNAKLFTDDTSLIPLVHDVKPLQKSYMMTWRNVILGFLMENYFQSWSDQTSPASYFQSQIKETDSPTLSFQ